MIRRLRPGDEPLLQELCRRSAGPWPRVGAEVRRPAGSVGAVKMWVGTDEANEAAKRTYASAGAGRAGENVLFGRRFTD